MELVHCPEIVDGERCDAIAEITRRDIVESTNGPLELVGTLCVRKHVLLMPLEMLDY